MIRRRKRKGRMNGDRHILPITLYCLLAFNTTPADAECAWVLWSESTDGYGPEGREKWSAPKWEPLLPYYVFARRAECEQEREHRIKTQYPISVPFWGPKGSDPNSPATGRTVILFYCLPSAVDPRAPKGK